MQQTDGISLTGIPLSVTRRLLKDADNPDSVADWQGQSSADWNGLLISEAYMSLMMKDATVTVLSWLTLCDRTEKVIVKYPDLSSCRPEDA